jgi:peroxiredoxin family protein
MSSEAHTIVSEAPVAAPETKSMTIIVTKGSLDWAYPPFILATTAAAMGLPVTMFFTFYGLPLLLKKLGLPNILTAIPGVDAACSKMMKNLMNKKGVASIEDLRELAIDADVRMIACQMTMDLFEYSLDDMIEGPELGGAATYIECATKSDINLFI